MSKEKIVDFEYAKEMIGGNEAVMLEILTMLLESLPDELEQLQRAYQEEDWKKIREVAHRLRGAASYCGTLRLRSVCAALEEYIESGLTARLVELYQCMLSEIDALQKFKMPKRLFKSLLD